MYSAVEIARIFVDKGIKEDNPVTQMKLQKVVYFAHGLYLANFDGKEKLISDPVEAWKFGPVFPNIYSEYSYFGSSPICPENDFLSSLERTAKNREVKLEKDFDQHVIDETWSALKNVSGIQLSKWTHSEGSAWSKSYKPDVRGIIINDEDIVLEFKPFIKEIDG